MITFFQVCVYMLAYNLYSASTPPSRKLVTRFNKDLFLDYGQC